LDTFSLIISHPRYMSSMLDILKEHVRKFEYASLLRAAGVFVLLGALNWVISRRFSTGKYKCWSQDEMEAALSSAGFAILGVEEAYACDANLLVCAERLPESPIAGISARR